MTRRRIEPTARQSPEAVVLIAGMAARLRDLEEELDHCEREADRAKGAASDAYTARHEAIRVYRNLVAALAGGGGFERTPPLSEAISDARDYLRERDEAPAD